MYEVVAYVATRGKGAAALEDGNIIAVCATGPNPLGDAKSYAFDETRATDGVTYVYQVHLVPRGAYKVEKQVIFAPNP